MRIGFEGLSAIIEVPDDPAFLEVLGCAAPDWPFAESPSEGEVIAKVRQSAAGYQILSRWNDDGTFIETTAVSAACSVVVDIITSYIEANPSLLCLHCGAVLVGGRLVVFPSAARAGKSTLIARLAASGSTVYGDDVLPLDPTDSLGMAPGLALRLRIPLPDKASPLFRQFVERHASVADDRYLYVNLDDGLAPRGASAPLGAIVLLDRREAGSASLVSASRAETLKALIRQNFARAETAGALLDRLHRLVGRTPHLTLRYSDVDEAAELIRQAFAGWPPDCSVQPQQSADAVEEPSETALLEHDSRLTVQGWRCNPAVKLRLVDGEGFLTGPDDTAIHHLNAIGVGLWNLLANTIDQHEAVAVLHGAFPDVDRTIIERDVAALFSEMAAADFILPIDGSF